MNGVHIPAYSALGEPITMPPFPANAAEECEWIIGFWTIHALHNCWGVALGSPMTLPPEFPGSQVNTLWLLDVKQYEQFPSELQGSFTVGNFLNSVVKHSFGSSRLFQCIARPRSCTRARDATQYCATLTRRGRIRFERCCERRQLKSSPLRMNRKKQVTRSTVAFRVQDTIPYKLCELQHTCMHD